MTYCVILTPHAERDRDRIYAYTVEQWGVGRAQQWYDGLYAALSALETLPERHPIAPESAFHTAQTVRQIVRSPFRILFVIRGRAVHVLHIRHAARLPVGAAEWD